jgi:2-C-methyl-D-erythritol 4-phosphate cytidylyltransferase
MNAGILLAAGTSARFCNNLPKQLYLINNIPMISYSVDILSSTLDKLVIVTNSHCFNSIKDLVGNNVVVLINDINQRLESIKTALNFLDGQNVRNIIIHDSARPFVIQKHITDMIGLSNIFMYIQYYLPLLNGLAEIKESGYNIVDRNNYIELCTPQMIDFNLYKYMFRNYIERNIDCEILPFLNKHAVNYKMICGTHKYLRKVTTLEDIY